MKAELRRIWQRALRAGMSVGPVRERTRRLAHAGRVPKKLWNRLPIVEPDNVFTVRLPGHASFRYRTSPADAIGQALYWRGVDGWERATIRAFMTLVRGARLFLDIGANTGAYSLIACALEPGLEVVAYEPVPRVYRALCANIELGDLGRRCQARQLAVAERAGQTELHVPHSAMPSSASLSPEGFRHIPGDFVSVPMTTVDLDIPEDQTVDLVKIDVEGFEDKVLLGMERVLGRDRPVIICECNPDGPYREVERILAAAGYTFLHIRDRGCERMARITPDPSERFRNFACVPRARLEEVEARLAGAPG